MESVEGGVVEAAVAAGDELAALLAEEPLELHARRGDERTGTAQITVDDSGENAIVVDSGANAAFTHLTAEEGALIAGASALLLRYSVGEIIRRWARLRRSRWMRLIR